MKRTFDHRVGSLYFGQFFLGEAGMGGFGLKMCLTPWGVVRGGGLPSREKNRRDGDYALVYVSGPRVRRLGPVFLKKLESRHVG